MRELPLPPENPVLALGQVRTDIKELQDWSDTVAADITEKFAYTAQALTVISKAMADLDSRLAKVESWVERVEGDGR